MYIGDVHDGSGLTHMLWELLANALDEHVRGTCKTASISMNEDGSVTVQDDDRGIPTHDLDGIPFELQENMELRRHWIRLIDKELTR